MFSVMILIMLYFFGGYVGVEENFFYLSGWSNNQTDIR